MALAVFDFPYHSIETEYPDSSAKMKFGRGYEFASKPQGPDQVKYILHFEAMVYVVTGGVIDRLSRPKINIAKLEDFYRAHRTYGKFTYPHPAEGNVTVRFASPLKFKQQPKGLGVIEPFSVELLLQP